MSFVGQTHRAVAEKLGFGVELLMYFQPAFETDRFQNSIVNRLKIILAHIAAKYILYDRKSKCFFYI